MVDELLDQIRDVLAHLYDYPYLQTHPLAGALDRSSAASPREAARLLRTQVLECIEELNPGMDVPLRSPAARSYNVLNLHYVEGLTVQEVARELAISERQVYRDLRQAEHDLATLFCAHVQEAKGDIADTLQLRTRLELALEEADRLAGRPECLLVRQLIEGALASVQQLGAQRGILFVQRGSLDLGMLYVDRQIARQALVVLFSYAVQQARADSVVIISGSRRGTEAKLCVEMAPASIEARAIVPPITEQFLHRLGGHCSVHITPEGNTTFSLVLRDQTQGSILVIDDNEGLIELFQRFLTGEPYRILAATDGEEGIELALSECPHVIVLDVMMPHRDGWEILQQLTTGEATRDIPIIVCSVLDEPELAYSLGAAGFLAKPVSRMELLRELARHCPALPHSHHAKSPRGT